MDFFMAVMWIWLVIILAFGVSLVLINILVNA